VLKSTFLLPQVMRKVTPNPESTGLTRNSQETSLSMEGEPCVTLLRVEDSDSNIAVESPISALADWGGST
jgi:hypothetical protein